MVSLGGLKESQYKIMEQMYNSRIGNAFVVMYCIIRIV